MKTNLKHMRKAAGWSNADEFAKSIGISPKTYRNYEQGVRMMGMDVACEICNALGCSPNDLVEEYLDHLTPSEQKMDVTDALPPKLKQLVDICSTLNEQQLDLIIATAQNFSVANLKDGAGDCADVERAEFVAR